MQSIISIFLFFSLIGGSCFAQKSAPCNSLEQCSQLRSKYQLLLGEIDAKIESLNPIPQILPPLRDREGNLIKLNYGGAIRACPKGTHLPSIREYARLTQSLGAMGVLEVSQVDVNHIPAKYELQSWKVSEKKRDAFYYNHNGYPVDNKLVDVWYWTSSEEADSDLIYVMYDDGGFFYYDRSEEFAVRCAVNY